MCAAMVDWGDRQEWSVERPLKQRLGSVSYHQRPGKKCQLSCHMCTFHIGRECSRQEGMEFPHQTCSSEHNMSPSACAQTNVARPHALDVRDHLSNCPHVAPQTCGRLPTLVFPTRVSRSMERQHSDVAQCSITWSIPWKVRKSSPHHRTIFASTPLRERPSFLDHAKRSSPVLVAAKSSFRGVGEPMRC